MSGMGDGCLDGRLERWQAELDELARVAQSGDRAALSDLAATVVPKLTNRARDRFYRKNDCEDLAHDTWRRLQENLPTYDTSQPLWPWASTILRHVCIDAIRKDKDAGEQQLSREQEMESRDDSRGQESGPLDILVKLEEYSRKRRNIFRVWVILWRYGGYPHQQLAFAYCRLISGDLLMRPSKVCERHGRTKLDDLARECYEDYRRGTRFFEGDKEAKELRIAMNPLFEHLACQFGELCWVNPHDNIKAYDRDLLETRTGRTSMSSYAAEGKLQSRHIYNWVDKVYRRIMREMLGEMGSDAEI